VVAERLEALPHYPLLTARQVRTLRRRDDVERRAYELRHHLPPPRVRRRWAEKAALKRAWRVRRKLAR
jgi:hypothetical protein